MRSQSHRTDLVNSDVAKEYDNQSLFQKSQSHRTDLVNSADIDTALRYLADLMSQSHRTDLVNSAGVRSRGVRRADPEVTIPPYWSGQFRLNKKTEIYILLFFVFLQSQSHRTDLVNSDPIWAFLLAGWMVTQKAKARNLAAAALPSTPRCFSWDRWRPAGLLT
jgi:hypothetical protein